MPSASSMPEELVRPVVGTTRSYAKPDPRKGAPISSTHRDILRIEAALRVIEAIGRTTASPSLKRPDVDPIAANGAGPSVRHTSGKVVAARWETSRHAPASQDPDSRGVHRDQHFACRRGRQRAKRGGVKTSGRRSDRWLQLASLPDTCGRSACVRSETGFEDCHLFTSRFNAREDRMILCWLRTASCK